MGMYTEFYFRAKIKDGPVADWLYKQINGEEWFETAFDDHPFFSRHRWTSVFLGGGAVCQESRKAILRPRARSSGQFNNTLVLASSLKDYGDEIAQFIDWVTPHLDNYDGDFLGYSLYEDSTDSDSDDQWRDHPVLYFHHREAVYA